MIARTLFLAMIALFCSFLIAPAPAQAACTLSSCNVTATAMTFGDYNPVSTTATDSTSRVRVICTMLAAVAGSFTIDLSTGVSADYAQRTMNNGASVLNYNLYTSASRTQIWGNGSGATPGVTYNFALATLLRVDQSFTVYGSIAAGQNVVAGSYADTITVTVTY